MSDEVEYRYVKGQGWVPYLKRDSVLVTIKLAPEDLILDEGDIDFTREITDAIRRYALITYRPGAVAYMDDI